MGRKIAWNAAKLCMTNWRTVAEGAFYPFLAMFLSVLVLSVQGESGTIISGLILLIAGPYFGRFINTCHRKVLLGEKPTRSLISLRLSVHDFYLLIVFMVFKGIGRGVEALGEFVLTLSGIAEVSGIALFLTVYFILCYISIRFVFVFPNIAIKHASPFKYSFDATSGNIWRIVSVLAWTLLLILALSVPLFLLVAIFGNIQQQVLLFISGIIYAVIYIVGGAFGAHSVSLIWQDITNEFDDSDIIRGDLG